MQTARIANPGEPDTFSWEANTAQMTMPARIVPASARAQPAAIVGPRGAASLSLRVSCALIDSSMPNEQKAAVDTAVAGHELSSPKLLGLHRFIGSKVPAAFIHVGM